MRVSSHAHTTHATAATASVSPFDMRVAVISDIHGNLHALEAVLADIDSQAPDEIWCLGDVVGYGPRPNECVALARERATVALCGNHDLAVIGTLDISDFSGDAAAAVRWTQEVLGARRAHLAGLVAARGDEARGRALPRQPARPGLGLRAQRGGRALLAARDDRAGGARRAQPRRARRSAGTARRSRAGSPRRARRPSCRPGAGSSTPARSGSRATATRGPPGC